MHEARRKYIYVTILVSEYANCIPLGGRNWKVCNKRVLLVLLVDVLSMQLDC